MHLQTYPQVKYTWRATPPAFALQDCSFCHGTGWQLIPVCGSSRARRCPCRDVTRLARLKESVGIPQRYEDCSFDGFDPRNLSQIRARDEARKFVERYPLVNRGLFFTGPPGTGKTHLAVAILRELLAKTQEDLLFADFELLSWRGFLRDAEARRHYEKRLQTCSLLVIDNLGAGAPSAEDIRFVQGVVDARLRRRRPTVLTGEPVRLRELFHGAVSPRASRTQLLLSGFHPSLLMRLLSSVKMIAVSGSDHRQFHPPLFP